jgi:hypothetical protein
MTDGRSYDWDQYQSPIRHTTTRDHLGDVTECVVDCEGCKSEKLRQDAKAVLGGMTPEEKEKLVELGKSLLEKKETGVKHDQGKDRWELGLEMDSLELAMKVLTYGANTKYSRGNYLNVIGWRWRYVGAALRHIRAYLKARRLGRKDLELDPDTGFPHLAHAIASLLMLLDNELNDRPNGDDEPEKVIK